MKKIIFIFLSFMILSSCAVEITEENFFINEDFTLIDKKEERVGESGTLTRTWLVQRIVQEGDSVQIAEIITQGVACGCGGKAFEITDELWYNKEIGDILHFEYLRKSRFFKKAKRSDNNITYAPDYVSPVPTTTVIEQPKNNLEIERQIMDIDRQILELERQKELLKLKR
jgi:hypothetical protein